MYCTNCGQEIINEGNFCSKCGLPINSDNNENKKPKFFKDFAPADSKSDGKIPVSYVISTIETLIVFFIRCSLQKEFKYWESVFKQSKYLGLEDTAKLPLTLFPILALFIVSVLIVSDKTKNIQKKSIAFIINVFLILLSVACIWYNIPT